VIINQKTENNMKKIVFVECMNYEVPTLEVIEVEVEKGFSGSNLETPGSDPEEGM